jgi:hypothetical protein
MPKALHIITEFTGNQFWGNTSITLYSHDVQYQIVERTDINMSTKRKFLLLISILALFIVGISAVGAQEGPGGPGGGGRPERPEGPRNGPVRQIVDIVSDATGLDPADVAEQLRDGATLADIITTSGGDVEAVINEVVTTLTDDINQAVTDGRMTQERADQMLTNLEDTVTRAVNGELFPNRLDRGPVENAYGRILVQAAADATGLDASDIRQQLRDGSTLADVISANGGDVDAVVSSAVTAATEQINAALADGRLSQEHADQLLANLSDQFTALVNVDLPPIGPVRARIAREVVQLAAEQTGLEPQAIMEQLRSGESLADVLTENNVDVTAFIDTAVEQATERLSRAVDNGRITQEQADEMAQTFRERLTEQINQSVTPEETAAI